MDFLIHASPTEIIDCSVGTQYGDRGLFLSVVSMVVECHETNAALLVLDLFYLQTHCFLILFLHASPFGKDTLELVMYVSCYSLFFSLR